MSNFDIYSLQLADWAYAMEIASPTPTGDSYEGQILVEKESSSLVIAVCQNDEGDLVAANDLELQVSDPASRVIEATDTKDLYAVVLEYEGYRQLSLLLVTDPPAGTWRISLKSHGGTPFFVNVSVFGSRTTVPNPRTPTVPGTPSAPRLRCRVCKTTAKALALAIIAAAALPALPHALIGAVAGYLGVGSVVAAAFIASVLGDTANEISEKLCRAIRLC
jgi:hypothetical protein